jgi:hypothetical protein
LVIDIQDVLTPYTVSLLQKLPVEPGFFVIVLDDVLDDEIGLCQFGHIRREVDLPQQDVLVDFSILRNEHAIRPQFGAHGIACLLQRLGGKVVQHHRIAVHRKIDGQAAPDRAGTDDCNRSSFHKRFSLPGNSIVPDRAR